VSEVVAYLLSGALYDKIGAKISFIGSFIIAIIGSIFYIIFGNP
jgi:MFS family permease